MYLETVQRWFSADTERGRTLVGILGQRLPQQNFLQTTTKTRRQIRQPLASFFLFFFIFELLPKPQRPAAAFRTNAFEWRPIRWKHRNNCEPTLTKQKKTRRDRPLKSQRVGMSGGIFFHERPRSSCHVEHEAACLVD